MKNSVRLPPSRVPFFAVVSLCLLPPFAALPRSEAADVESISLVKARFYKQRTGILEDGLSVPLIDRDSGHHFIAQVQAASDDAVEAVEVDVPGGGSLPLNSGGGLFYIDRYFADQAALDAAFPNGEYTVTIDPQNDGGGDPVEVSLVLAGDHYPPAPRITNLPEADGYFLRDRDNKIYWEPWLEAQRAPAAEKASYFMLFTLYERQPDGSQAPVFSTGLPGSGLPVLTGDAESVTIPAGTFRPLWVYPAELFFIRITDAKATPYTASAIYFSRTDFYCGEHFALFYSRSVPDAVKGAANYSAQLEAKGGVPPYVWQILDSNFGTNTLALSAPGLLTGSTPEAGVFPFTAQVRDQYVGYEKDLRLYVVDPAKPDILHYGLFKGRRYRQSIASGAVEADATEPNFAFAYAEAASPHTADLVAVTPNGSAEAILPREDRIDHYYRQRRRFGSQSALDAEVQPGAQAFLFRAAGDGTKVVSLNLPSPLNPYPQAPQISAAGRAALHGADPSEDIEIAWNAWPGAGAADKVWVEIFQEETYDGEISARPVAYVSPLPWRSGAIPGPATMATIPAGTLAAGEAYTGRIWFARTTAANTAAYPGAAGSTGYASETEFLFGTQLTYDQWVRLTFVPTYWDDPAWVGRTVDREGDGLTNAEEYAYLGNYFARDPAPTLAIREDGSDLLLSITHLSIGADLVFTLEAAGSPAGEWEPVTGAAVEVAEDGGTWQTTRYRIPKASYPGKYFFRHRMVLLPPPES